MGAGEEIFYGRYTGIFADFLCELVTDFFMSWESRPFIELRIMPPGMPSTIPQQLTCVCSKVTPVPPVSYSNRLFFEIGASRSQGFLSIKL